MSSELRFLPEQEEKIANFLKKVKFRKRIFGLFLSGLHFGHTVGNCRHKLKFQP